MATEHEYRLAYEGLQARYVAHVDRLDVEIKELQQRLAKFEAAATELAELTNPLLEQDQMAIYRARVKVGNLCSSSPALGTEKGG